MSRLGRFINRGSRHSVPADPASVLLKEGAEALHSGDTKRGLEKFDAALSALSGRTNSRRRLELQRQVAFAHRKAGDTLRARELLDSQCEDAAALGDFAELANGRYDLGLLYLQAGDNVSAEQNWAIAVDVSRQGHIFTVWSDALSCIAILRKQAGFYDTAESMLNEARLAAERGENAGQLADVLDDLARLQLETGRKDSAILYARQAVAAYRQAGDEEAAERVAREFLD